MVFTATYYARRGASLPYSLVFGGVVPVTPPRDPTVFDSAVLCILSGRQNPNLNSQYELSLESTMDVGQRRQDCVLNDTTYVDISSLFLSADVPLTSKQIANFFPPTLNCASSLLLCCRSCWSLIPPVCFAWQLDADGCVQIAGRRLLGQIGGFSFGAEIHGAKNMRQRGFLFPVARAASFFKSMWPKRHLFSENL